MRDILVDGDKINLNKNEMISVSIEEWQIDEMMCSALAYRLKPLP